MLVESGERRAHSAVFDLLTGGYSYDSYPLPPEYLCHVYVRNDSLSAVVIADSEYPQRVAFTLLDKVGRDDVRRDTLFS